MSNPFTMFAVALASVLVAMGLSIAVEPGPVAGAQSMEASAPDVVPTQSGQSHRKVCKSRFRVEIRTIADKYDSGRVVIGEWRRKVEELHGAEWSNFKAAIEPVARCRTVGKEVESTCWAEGSPCRG